MHRRRLLRLSGTALAAAVAGCGGDDAETDRPTDGGDATPAPTATSSEGSPTATPTPSPTVEPTPTQESTPTAAGTPDPDATATATPTSTATATATPQPTATPREAAAVVAVGDGGLSFAPDSVEVAVGERVVWMWESSNHNVRPSGTPSGSDFSGTPGGDGDYYDEGYEFAHTFEVAGEYDYYCALHRSAGMTGSVTVTE